MSANSNVPEVSQYQEAVKTMPDYELANLIKAHVVALNWLASEAANRELLVQYRIKPEIPRIIVNILMEVA